METPSSTSKWIEAPPSISTKEWFPVAFGVVMVALTLVSLLTHSLIFIVSLVLTLCGVAYIVHRQIDQANQAARTLYESEQRFRLLVEEVRDYAIFGLDSQGCVTSWNSGAERMTGFPPQQIIGQAFSKLCVNEPQKIEQTLATAIREGRFQIEDWLIRKDGSRFLARTVITPMEDNTGALRGFSVIASDETTRKEAEAALLENHRFIQRVTAAVPDMLFLVELEPQRIEFINNEAGTVLGFSEGTVNQMGKNILQHLLHEDDRICLKTIREKCEKLRDGELIQTEVRLRDATGDWRWFSIRTVVFSRDKEGRATQCLCVAQDLSLLKRAQEDVRRFEQVALSRERLALLGELSASVAHELRNPLLGVQHCIEELRSRCGNRDGLKELVDLLEQGLVRMDHVSSRLLRMARNDEEAGALADVDSCIEGTCAFVRSLAQKAGVQLHVDIEPGLPKVPLHAERLSEALLNLIYNAIDACQEGDSISLKVRNAQEMNKLEILVSDTGAGIPPENRERIFEAFFTTKAPGRGTGLGMTIVGRIIEAHKGSIELLEKSPATRGTTFRILLPMDIQDVREES